MIDKVFNYIKGHPLCTAFDIAKALDVSPLAVLVAASELKTRGFITHTTTILKETNDEGMAYSAIKESFIDNSEFCSCYALHSVTTESADVGYWDVCSICGKRLQGGFHYYPEFEGMEYDIRLE